MSNFLKYLVAWLPREAIRDNLPEAFIKTGKNKCRVFYIVHKILLKIQNIWIVKLEPGLHHNTIKFLVGISPSLLHFYIYAMVAEQVISSSLRIVAFMTLFSVTM